MSNQKSSYTSYSSSSYTTSSSTNNSQPHTQSYTENASYDSRHGGNIERISAETGQPTLTERREFPVQGTVGAGNAAGNRIEDVTGKDAEQEQEQEQARRDREYEERMEEEYAKREGGA